MHVYGAYGTMQLTLTDEIEIRERGVLAPPS